MRKLLIALFALIAIISSPSAAFAHAGLVSSNPEANKEITAMPSEISLTFTEDLLTLGDKNVNTISLNRLDGPEVPLTNITVKGAVITATVPQENFESGSYEVFYSIVSADGHKVSDSYRFSLNAPTLLTAPNPAAETGKGVIPLPIVAAIIIVLLLGGYFALRARNRKI